MTGFRKRAAPDEEAQARRTLEGAVAALRNCQRGGIHSVPVEDVLRMLRDDPEASPVMPARDPRADPLTGCLPATPR